MGLSLHGRYSMGEAVAAFGGDPGAASDCGGEFVVLPGVVLGFVTVGRTDAESHVAGPSDVTWRPGPGAPPALGDDWLPEPVREVFDRSGTPVRRIRDHHLLVRAPGTERFWYAGRAHLGSYGGHAANFTLDARLPRAVWLELGGYPGWQVQVDDEVHLVAAGDRAAFGRLAAGLAGREFAVLALTRYEEDSLTLHANARRGWLMYLREPGDCGLYTRDREYRGPADARETFQCECGVELEFAADRTLPREQAARVVAEFCATGQLPRDIPWEDEP